jgi:uncharacterized protein with GYD domain
MPTYVTLAEFTERGIEHVADSPELIDTANDAAEAFDGELLDVYVTLGDYDVVMLSEFPDDESYAQFALTVAKAGDVSTESLTAFTAAEYRDVVAGLVGQPAGPAGEF